MLSQDTEVKGHIGPRWIRTLLCGACIAGGFATAYATGEAEPSTEEISPAPATEIAEEVAPPPPPYVSTGRAALYDNLLQAIQAHDLYAVSDFVHSGTDITQPIEGDLDAFLVATKEGAPFVVNEILAVGHPIETTDTLGNAALHLAAAANDVYMIDFLADRGANPNAVNKANYSPLHTAAEQGSVDAIGALVRRGGNPLQPLIPDVVSGPMTTAAAAKQWAATRTLRGFVDPPSIFFAAGWGDLDNLRELLALNPQSVNETKIGIEETPIFVAIRGKQLDAVKLLVASGADLSLRSSTQQDALECAIDAENFEAADFLLSQGAEIDNSHSSNTKAMIFRLVSSSSLAALDYAIKHGARVDLYNDMGETPLHIAAMSKMSDKVNLLLDRGADIEAKTRDGQTPLHYAVKIGDVAVATQLLERGADINAKDLFRQTPMHIAFERNDEPQIEMLLKHGGDILPKDRDGQTPLHIASRLGNATLAARCVALGADIEATDNERRSPLHVAVENGKDEVANLLLDLKADFNALDREKRTVLFTALLHERGDIAKRIHERGADIEFVDRNGQTPIFAAIHGSDKTLVEWIVDLGAKIDHADNSGRQPIHEAAAVGAVDTVEFLLSRAARLDARDNAGQTPLHLASLRGHVLVVKTLVNANADLFAKDNEGRLPIHVSAGAGHWGPTQMYILRGLDIEVRDGSGNTPLLAAAANGQARAVRLLAGRGADLLARNADEKSAMDLVLDKQRQKLAASTLTPMQITTQIGFERTLIFLRAAFYEEIRSASITGNTARLTTLLDCAPSMVNGTVFGLAPIHHAAREGQRDVLKLLAERGADLDQPTLTPASESALHIAARNGKIDAACWLVDNGANLDVKDAAGMTAIDAAQQAAHPEVASMIAEHMARRK